MIWQLLKTHISSRLAHGAEDAEHLRLERLLRVASGLQGQVPRLKAVMRSSQLEYLGDDASLLGGEPGARGDVVDADGEPRWPSHRAHSFATRFIASAATSLPYSLLST